MRENNENWIPQLDKVLTEIVGLNEIIPMDDKFLNLIANLEGLKRIEMEFFSYRKIVFESISLLRGCIKNVE